MKRFELSAEKAIEQIGIEKSVSIAREISLVALKYGLSLSQTDAVFEIAKDLLKTVPLSKRD